MPCGKIIINGVEYKVAPDVEDLVKHLQNEVTDYEEAAADKRRLAREMAVMIDGPEAANQPSLCDVAAMVRDLVAERDRLREELNAARIVNGHLVNDAVQAGMARDDAEALILQAHTTCQMEADRGQRNGEMQYHRGAIACRDGIRNLIKGR